MAIESTTHNAEARVVTAVPRRYLGQLCKHFQHKLPATYDETYEHGRIEFSVGPCDLVADEPGATLIMKVSAASPEDLERLEDVVTRHLVRFAFREELSVVWVPAD